MVSDQFPVKSNREFFGTNRERLVDVSGKLRPRDMTQWGETDGTGESAGADISSRETERAAWDRHVDCCILFVLHLVGILINRALQFAA